MKLYFIALTVIGLMISSCTSDLGVTSDGVTANTSVESDATSLILSLSEKDRGILAKCGGGLSQSSSAKVITGIREGALTGEFKKDSNVLAGILDSSSSLATEEIYSKYTSCLAQLDPELNG